MEIKYYKEKGVKIAVEGDRKILYIPEEKFKKLFPLAYRRGLEVVIVHEDDKFVTVSTTIPEQKQPRIKKVPRALLYGDIKRLVDVIKCR